MLLPDDPQRRFFSGRARSSLGERLRPSISADARPDFRASGITWEIAGRHPLPRYGAVEFKDSPVAGLFGAAGIKADDVPGAAAENVGPSAALYGLS